MNNERSEAAESAIVSTSQRPAVIANFSGYTPPFDVVPIVERMLASVQPNYLIGLKEVVLTNSTGLSRKLRRSTTKSRKHKVKIVECRGLYHQAWNGNRAWIEIFVDNTLKYWEKGFWLRIPFIREESLGGVLFHEVGHHIHYTVRPEYREKEDVADVWKVRLEHIHFQQRFPLLRAFFRLFTFLGGPFYKRLRVKLMKNGFQKGWMSRAEYEEETVSNKSRD